MASNEMFHGWQSTKKNAFEAGHIGSFHLKAIDLGRRFDMEHEQSQTYTGDLMGLNGYIYYMYIHIHTYKYIYIWIGKR